MYLQYERGAVKLIKVSRNLFSQYRIAQSLGQIDERRIDNSNKEFNEVGRGQYLKPGTAIEDTPEGYRTEDGGINSLRDHGRNVIPQPEESPFRLSFPEEKGPDVVVLRNEVGSHAAGGNPGHQAKYGQEGFLGEVRCMGDKLQAKLHPQCH